MSIISVLGKYFTWVWVEIIQRINIRHSTYDHGKPSFLKDIYLLPERTIVHTRISQRSSAIFNYENINFFDMKRSRKSFGSLISCWLTSILNQYWNQIPSSWRYVTSVVASSVWTRQLCFSFRIPRFSISLWSFFVCFLVPLFYHSTKKLFLLCEKSQIIPIILSSKIKDDSFYCI